MQKDYGITNTLQIEYNRPAGEVYFRGQGEAQSFEVVLTKRAMHLLWYRLTQALYPHEAPTMIGTAGTAPLRSQAGHLFTTSVNVRVIQDSGTFEVIGSGMNMEWTILISEADARRLWAELDIILFPYGWEGREGMVGDNGVAVN